MRKTRTFITALFVGFGLGLSHAASAAPATLVQPVTYSGQTITMQLTKENLRGANFELLAQNATGSYDVITPVAERSYIGTVAEYPGAVSYGILQDDGSFKGGVIFDRGDCWYVFNNGVSDISWVAQPTSFGYSADTVGAGQGGSTVYGFDVGIDARYEYFNERGGASLAKTLEVIEFSLAQNRALYLHDALLRPFLARVIIRTDAAMDPAKGLTGGTYLDALKNEWNNNQTSANRDVVAGVATSHVWAGLAWVNVIASNLAYSVNDSQGDGNFNKVWQHELGHNWGLSHYDGGAPEAGTINSNNHFARMSGPELQKVLNQRNSKLWALDNLGSMTTVNIPPYASYDSRTFTQVVDSQLTIDVLANDHDANGHALSLVSVQSATAQGGTASLQSGRVVYTPRGDFSGVDSFTYKIQDSSGQTATGAVAVNVVVQYNDASPVVVANHSFESGPTTGVPTGWTLTAGSSSNLGLATGATTDGAKFLWIGPGAELTQDLGYTLSEGEKLTLKYASDRTQARTIQFLAKSGGVYTMIAETTAATGWAGWAYNIQLDHTVAAANAGQELVIRIISGGWNQFDNFRVTTIKGASRPSPFSGATGVGPVNLSWSAISTAVQHQVYVGTSESAVQNATTASPEYRGSVTGSSIATPTNPLTTYYWRVDTVTASGTEIGPVWKFTRNNIAGIAIANASFETGPATGVPSNWTLTAGSSSSLGVAAGGSNGAQFLYIGPGVAITQDLAYTLTNGEALTLKYDSSRNHVRNIQLLAKNGGTYTLMAETTATIGSGSWSTATLNYTVAAQYAGQQLALRIISGNWNEFDNFRLTTVPATNNAPTWSSNPVVEVGATESSAYSSTLADNAADVDSDPLTFSKVSGPAWLNVASNGTLSGTPGSSNVGSNSWAVRVTDSKGASADATLQIQVSAMNHAPVFNANPLVKADAMQGSAYSGSIAAGASDSDNDPLTFNKNSGPAWLTVASNGTLSGTPGAGDVGVNQWSVSATDPGSLSATTTLRITVAALPSIPVSYAPTSQTTTYGSVTSGGISQLTTSDNSYEVLREAQTGSTAATRVSRLQHSWKFDLGTGGSAVALDVEAFHTINTEGDDFIFSWSSNGTTFTDVITVTKTADNDQVQTATLPANLTGPVWIQVRDADRTPGNGSMSRVYIDRLNLRVTP